MNSYKILGHNIFTNEWVSLGIIVANTKRGANQKAHRLFGLDFDEFGVWEVEVTA